MAISYPVALPTNITFASIDLRAVNAVAVSRSPFTFSTQVQNYSGQMWQADASLPPMKRDLAEAWVSTLLSLRGQYGTFYLGDPLNTSVAGLGGDATFLSVSGFAGDSTVSILADGTINAGTWFSLGTGINKRLYKVLQNVTTSPSTAEIYPALRFDTTLTGGTADLTSAQGVFRLSSNETSWSINEISSYGITLSAVEALAPYES